MITDNLMKRKTVPTLAGAAALFFTGAPSVHATTVYQINCGGGGTGTWVYDQDYSGGTALGTSHSINTSTVTSPAPAAVYQHERYGAITYTLPSLTAGAAYTVRLHFCEFEYAASGQRKFNVLINGTQVLTNFDVFAAAGGEYIANIQQFNATANSGGNIVIQWTNGSAGSPQITGIELLTGGTGTAPSTPTGVSATAGNSQVTLGWSASSGATSYNVYRSTTSGGEGTTPIATGISSTSYTNTALTNGTKYYYKVAAVNSVGTSAQSVEVSATPQASLPSAPTNLSASATGSSQINLTWTASSTSGVTYNVFRGTTAGGEGGSPIATGLTSTSYSNTGLVASTTYYYKVAAVNGSGTSPLSNEASATTAAAGAARACWVWNASTIVTSSSATSSLFSFLAAPKGVSSHAIKMICCAFSLGQLTDPTVGPEIRSFLSTAHSQGIRVYFVCGDPTWATTNEADGLNWLNGVLSFNSSGSPKFDGFQYDVEPYTIAGWPSTSMENGWVKLMSDSKSAITSSGQSLTFSATIPFWLDSASYNYCDQGIINNCNEVSIMDYTTSLTNFENFPAAEVAYSNSAGKKVWIGAETNNEGSNSVSFYGLGNAAMENEFSGAQSYYQGQPSFVGYQIDDYTGYVNLGP